MAREKKKIADPMSNQMSLFDQVKEKHKARLDKDVKPGSFNIGVQIREMISEGIKQSGLSRYETAARMSELVGEEITKSQLDSWTAESKEGHRFPVQYLAAFAKTTGYIEPLRLIADMIGCYIVESEGALLSELGRIDQYKRKLSEREKAIREFLKQMKS